MIHLLAIEVRFAAKPLVYLNRQRNFYKKGEAFWRNEEIASQYIPNYTFKEWRKIRQQYVEMPMSKDTAHVLGIENLPNTPFTVVIDVNKEVKPFIRPEIEAC